MMTNESSFPNNNTIATTTETDAMDPDQPSSKMKAKTKSKGTSTPKVKKSKKKSKTKGSTDDQEVSTSNKDAAAATEEEEVEEEEEDYSIATLLRKKQEADEEYTSHSKSSHQSRGSRGSRGSSGLHPNAVEEDDDDDIDDERSIQQDAAAVNAVLAHTETMRQDTIATVASSVLPLSPRSRSNPNTLLNSSLKEGGGGGEVDTGGSVRRTKSKSKPVKKTTPKQPPPPKRIIPQITTNDNDNDTVPAPTTIGAHTDHPSLMELEQEQEEIEIEVEDFVFYDATTSSTRPQKTRANSKKSKRTTTTHHDSSTSTKSKSKSKTSKESHAVPTMTPHPTVEQNSEEKDDVQHQFDHFHHPSTDDDTNYQIDIHRNSKQDDDDVGVVMNRNNVTTLHKTQEDSTASDWMNSDDAREKGNSDDDNEDEDPDNKIQREKHTIEHGITIDRHRTSHLDDDMETPDTIQSTTALSVLSHRITIPNAADHFPDDDDESEDADEVVDDDDKQADDDDDNEHDENDSINNVLNNNDNIDQTHENSSYDNDDAADDDKHVNIVTNEIDTNAHETTDEMDRNDKQTDGDVDENGNSREKDVANDDRQDNCSPLLVEDETPDTTATTTSSKRWWSSVVSRVMKAPANTNKNSNGPSVDQPSTSPTTMTTSLANESQSMSPKSPTSPRRLSNSTAMQLFSGVMAGRAPKSPSSSPPAVNTTSSDYSISNFDHESEGDDYVKDDDEINPMSQAPAVHDDVENENEDDYEQETERAATYDEKMHDEDDDDDDNKIIDELSSYHDEEDDVYDDGDIHPQYPPDHHDSNWNNENDNDHYGSSNNSNYFVDEHGNYHSNDNGDEEYYDDNYNDGLYHDNNDYNDNDTLTDHDLEYTPNYGHHDQNGNGGEDDGMLYNSTTQMEKSYYERRQRKRKQKQIIFGIVLCCCLILVAVVIVVVFEVILPSKEDDKNVTPSSSSDNICAPFQSSIGTAELCTILANAIIPVHPNRTISNLKTPVPASCQFLTLDWMIGTISGDLKIVKSVNRIRQRYSLGVFHCELYTASWFTLDMHLTGDNNECTWSTTDLTDEITDVITNPCNGNNDVQILRIINGNSDDSNKGISESQLQFRGTLPPELSMITSLKEITLMDHSTNLYGTIPSEYSMLTTLETFHLPSNTLNGSLPNFIYNIRYVDLSNNTLTGTIPTRPAALITVSKQFLRMPTSSTSRSKSSWSSSNVDTYNNADDYYYHRRRDLQDQEEMSTDGIPYALLLHENRLSGKLSLADIVRPGMEVFTIHKNLLTGFVLPPTLDQSKNLRSLTMNDNNVTGNVNVLCPLSASNGGILSTFVVDMDEVICSCCTDEVDIYEDGFGNISPTISVPKVQPPSMAPKVTNTPTSIRPTVLNLKTFSPTIPMIPTFVPVLPNSTNATDSNSPSAMPTAVSGIIIEDPVPSSNTSITTNVPTIVSVSIPLDDGVNDTTVLIDSNFTTRQPFQYFTTTKMEPYYSKQQPFDCNFTDNAQPHVLAQCRCYNTIQVLTDDIVGLYGQVRAAIQNEIYTARNNMNYPFINETIDSCSAQNQALVWLSSGNVRDGGDLYQRYILALLYLQTNGTAWYNASKWLTYENECDWYGIDCRSSTADDTSLQVRSIQLDNNNIQKTIPIELQYLSTLQTISLRNN